MIYILSFLLSLAFARIAFFFDRKTIARKAFLVLSILIPCLLAAFRSTNIGTDVHVYAENWFNLAKKSNSIGEYFGLINTTDILYALTTYFSAKICGEIWLLFLAAQLLTILPIVFVLYKQDNPKKFILGMAVYYLFFYNISLNLMRQSISLSMSLLSFYYLINKDSKKYILFTILATLFHFSGILGLLFALAVRVKKTKTKRIFILTSIVAVFFTIFFFEDIVRALNGIGLMPERYLSYTTRYLRSGLSVDIVRELYFGMILVFSLICPNDKYNIKYLSIIGFMLFQVGLVSNYAYRISYILFYPALFIQIPDYLAGKNTKNAKIFLLILLAGMSAYWVQQIVILKIHETYPYELMERNI